MKSTRSIPVLFGITLFVLVALPIAAAAGPLPARGGGAAGDARHAAAPSVGEGKSMQDKTVAVDMRSLKSLAAVIAGVAGKRIVYVGEQHDEFSHHAVELAVIKALYRKEPEIAIGMEMFQRPFQKALDAYIAGTIDERTFLKQSEYFSRWGYDYHLYKPILDFAREKHIPVVALNLRAEIVDAVAKSGIASLTDAERKELPSHPDFSDKAYRDRLRKVFAQHPDSDKRNFDYFCQAQILWDETMAQSIDEYLNKHAGCTMIVLAGEGHIAYGSGIPKRAFRRNGIPYATILNDADVVPGIADYLVFPPAEKGTETPLLGVSLREDAGRVVVSGLPGRKSPARTAGIREGDVITAIAGSPVASIDDAKIALFYTKPGATVAVTLRRPRFLLGPKELTVSVPLH